MPTLFTVLNAIQQQVALVTEGLFSSSPDTLGAPINVEVGLYWPSAKALHSNVHTVDPVTSNLTALVTIYDRGLAKDSTRWLPGPIGGTVTTPTLTATVNGVPVVVTTDPYIGQLGTAVIVLGGTVTPGDAIGVVLSNSLNNPNAVVAVGGATDTPATMATQLAALINGTATGLYGNGGLGAKNGTLPLWVSATAVGSTVTITSLVNQVLSLQLNIGNGGTILTEIGRRQRHFQIVVWTRTPDDRITVGDPIEVWIAEAEANFGLTFPDGTMGRLTFYGDMLRDDATLSDTLRRDFLIAVDYPITTTDQAYAVLAPIQNVTGQY